VCAGENNHCIISQFFAGRSSYFTGFRPVSENARGIAGSGREAGVIIARRA
jgi:hypothetical protein